MNVSFTGFKNAGFLNLVQSSPSQIVFDLNAQLTDDFNGKDLSEFRDAMKRSNVGSSFINPVNPNFINIMGIRAVDENGYKDFIFLNNKELEVCDRNLPLFTNIAKIAKKISLTPVDKFVVNSDYLSSDDLRYGLLLDTDMKENCGRGYNSLMKKVHRPETVINGAMMVNALVHSMMVDYFA